MLSLPRVTMQDVARAAGVHQTTVSLALRNDPRLPEKTRVRLQKFAERLGYHPDPMLGALNFYRSSRRPLTAQTTVAFLLNFRDRDELDAWRPHRLFLEGARKQAAQIGYHVEVFYVRPTGGPAEGRRMERILRTRGIAGVIIAAFSDDLIRFRMDWQQFSTVLIESSQLGLSLHTISNDQLRITRQAVARLHAMGYRRIALAVGRRGEVNLRNAFTAGYHAEIALRDELPRIPPLLLAGERPEDLAPALDAWLAEHRPDVVASNWAQVVPAIRLTGRATPGEVAVASLDLMPEQGANAGMRQNHAIVGERAVEQLAILLKTNQRGLVEIPNQTLIEGCWVDGTDVPPRIPAAARRRQPASGRAR